MADASRRTTDSLNREMQDRPYEFDFFQIVRRIENLSKDKPRIGTSKLPSQDPIRFCQEVSLAFSPSTVTGYRDADPDHPAKLSVACFGLLGPNGPMPLWLTDYARGRLLNFKDESLTAFLDIFHHRMISLFYRAWAYNQQAVSFDRPEGDWFARYIRSLIGMGQNSLRDRDAVADSAKQYYSGRLACPTRNAEGLEAIVADYFNIPVQVESFVGQWIEIPPAYRCRLGESAETGSLGASVVVGSYSWQCQQRFRLRLGPMGLEDYERFLPGNEAFREMVAWIRNYVGYELSGLLKLILRVTEVPSLCLGQRGTLGQTTWLLTRGLGRDADDLEFPCVA